MLRVKERGLGKPKAFTESIEGLFCRGFHQSNVFVGRNRVSAH
jgi:hypothetical protein